MEKKMEKEKEENIWRKTFFCRGEGKGGKYLENNNILCRGEAK